ncbi:GNAT family N-acetyltransferase [Psychroserpens luteolus]|uniref:GNAT family N-acetyltransferase n=1 Tax=Psychroserpens luteolus TaxID=2855840 RepID=UPI001E47E24F|nr:GNAT family N-acetyltransferase [Psychroserpens luteolus]MCD2260753.1 GNAT family N-acetyltransferase [Psychroserpens luteolus]
MNFIKTDDATLITPLRQELYNTFTTALDSMWESLYIASSTAYLIKNNNEIIGYCCIDNDDSLTQIYLSKPHLGLMQNAIKLLIDTHLITSAKLSSIEPVSFNTCILYSISMENNTFCFQYDSDQKKLKAPVELILATNEDIDTIKSFYKAQVGFEDTFGYTKNLVQRNELYILKDQTNFIGTGECRLSDSQPKFADVGVAVHTNFRGKGYATQILNTLAQIALSKNRRPICSTTIDNIASKKAIEKAGFHYAHSIIDISFV